VGGVSRGHQPAFDFVAADLAAEDGVALIVDLDGYEGPLHVLLALARSQKVDLLQLSVTKLADQYLAFVHQARRAQFSLAADYLVMAAWLAYLKSRLLLPKPVKDTEPPPEEMAASLAFRLAKLDAMRRAVEALGALPQLGRDVFRRGDPDEVKITSNTSFEGDLYGLVQAYIGQRQRDLGRRYQPARPTAYPLDDARRRLRGKLSEMRAWTALQAIAPTGGGSDSAGANRASCLASTLAASLELVKEGALEARQFDAFADLYLRAKTIELEGG
jgi:segregation and condensation protein A